MKFDFRAIKVQYYVEGEPLELDIRHALGNVVWRAADIAISDMGRAIYHSDGEIDIPDPFVPQIAQVVAESSIMAPVKRVVKELFILRKEANGNYNDQ